MAAAIIEGTEDWYNPQRRQTSLEDRSPAAFETLHTAANEAA
jgi:hypothetical protein